MNQPRHDAGAERSKPFNLGVAEGRLLEQSVSNDKDDSCRKGPICKVFVTKIKKYVLKSVENRSHQSVIN